jgi:hypothetical protein
MDETAIISVYGWTHLRGTHSEARLGAPRREGDPDRVTVTRTGISHGPGGWDLTPTKGRLTLRPAAPRMTEPGS